MESTTNINSAGVTAFIDDALRNDPSKAVGDFASSSERDKDFAGFSNAGKIHKTRIPKGGTMEDDNTSPEESPARKGNLMEAHERVSPVKEHIKASDICYTTKNTTEVVKEFSNTENIAQSFSYDAQHKQAPQMYQLSISTGVHCDSTHEHNTVIEQPQPEVKPGIEDCCFQTRAAESVMNSSQDAHVGCREWTVPVDAERRFDEHEKDSICAQGSNSVSSLSDLASSETARNILDDAFRTQVRYLHNYENQTLGVVCPASIDAGNSSVITGETESSTVFAADHDITAASALSTSRVSFSAASIETGTNYTTSTPEVKISAASIETDTIRTLSAPDIYISATATEIDNSSTTSSRKVDISTHLGGDSTDIINVQRNEIQDGPCIKINEISPDINDTEKIPLLENNTPKNTRNCCPQVLVSNYLSKEDNAFVNSENEGPGDYTIENALFLVRSYISELERVATNIERILQSDSSRLEMNKKGDNNRKVSDSQTEFEGNTEFDTTGDNLEMIAGNIGIELSDPLAEDIPAASVKAVDVKEDIAGLGEDFCNRNEECRLEYVSLTHGEFPAQCSARCHGANSGLHGDQARCSSVSSNSEIEAHASDLHHHNVNNNRTCYVSANVDNKNNSTYYVSANINNKNNNHALWDVNANAKKQLLREHRKLQRIFSLVCTDTLDVKGHMHYINLTANTGFNRVDTNYANINNNGNTISSTSRNITLTSEPARVPTTQMHTEHDGLKTRNQHFRNKLTTPGCDILVFEGSKVYSVTQKASNGKELVGTFVSDAGESKPQQDSSDKSQSGLVSSADTPLHGCENLITFSEINDGLARQCEKSGEHQAAQEVSQTHSSFDTYSLKIADALRLHDNEKVQSERDVYLNNNNDDDRASQTSYSESKQNQSVNVVDDNFTMLKVDTMASANYQNRIHGCQLQPMRIMRYEAEQARQNAKRAKTTKRSRSRAYMDNKHQYRRGKCVNDSSLLDIVSAAQGGGINTQGKMERDSLSLPVSCKQCRQTSATTTLLRDNRWASALGSNENRSTDMNKIEYPKKRNFPMRIRAASRQNQKDVYIPARTRRLTVESPAENLLVHTSYDRPNPKQREGVINIEMANRSNVLYLGSEDDHINTDGTRRLVCETECLSSKDPKTKYLVIENRALNVSYGKIHPVSEETKTRWESGISVAAEEINRAEREQPEMIKNVNDKSIKWRGVSCARMIGNFVVIGTTKSIQSVVNMVHNQIQYSIPTGVNCAALDMPEAGDVGHNVPRKVAVCDRRGAGESGDHLTMAITDNDYSNSNNNNVCMQGTVIGYNHIQRLHHKVEEPRHGDRHSNMAFRVNRMPYSTLKANDGLIFETQTKLFLGSRAIVDIYTVIQLIYQLRNKTIGIIHCRFYGLLLSRCTLATISYEANRNNSSARENYDWWEGNKSAPRSTNEASTGTTDLNSEDVAFVKGCESSRFCSPCSACDQVRPQDKHVKLQDFVTQVAATDINPTTESQTCDSLQAPSDTHLRLRNSAGRLSLVDEDINFRRHKKVSCRNCNSCCELRSSSFKVELANEEIDTQVQATDINPSNLAQTGKSLITIDSRLSSQIEVNNYWRAVSSNISLHLLHYEPQPEADVIDIFVTKSLETNSLWTFNDSEHPQQVPVTSSSPTLQSFNGEQRASSYHSHEHTHDTELADENPLGTITPRSRRLSGLEMQEAGLIWQNNSFVPQQELGVTRSGQDLSEYKHLKSELEFFMNDEDIFGSHENGQKCKTNSINYVPNNVDHESGGYRVASIPTSRMSLTVLNPAPVYDFTFTKDHWQAKYKKRILRGNSSQDRDVEETDDSDEEEEDQARGNTVKDDKEVATVVGCKRQRSEDQNLYKRAKSSAHRRFIIY